jgi:integrase
MPRIPKPYLYKGWYRTNAGGKRQHPLCRDVEGMTKARRVLNAYLGQLQSAQAEGATTTPVGSGLQAKPVHDPESGPLAGEVHDLFLDFKKTESDQATYKHYLDKLKPFVERFGHRPLISLTEADGVAYKRWLLTEKEWVKGNKKRRPDATVSKVGKKKRKDAVTVKGVGPTTCNHFIRAAKTLLNWAAHPKRHFLPHNPWSEIGYLDEKPRERLITAEEFRHLHEQASDDDFRDTLFFMRHTTARPGEVRAACWTMIDWNNHRINLDRRKVKTRKSRSLTMTPDVEELLRRRLEVVRQKGGDTSGRIFRNADGGEWEAVSFSQRFRRLRNRCVRLGLLQAEKAGEKLVLYSTRHTRNVEMIRDEGIDVSIASKEMGHANVSTTVRHYLHLSKQDVTDAVRKGKEKGVAGQKGEEE